MNFPRAFPGTLSSLLVFTLLAGWTLASPGGVAAASFPDYCDVSGISGPPEANGRYYYTGHSLDGYPRYRKTNGADYIIVHETRGGGPSLWWITVEPGGELFNHASSSAIPPSAGWSPAGGAGAPAVACAPTSSSPQKSPPKTPVAYFYAEGKMVALSCRRTESIALAVKGGHMAVFTCPVSGLGSSARLAQEELPGRLPGGAFVAAVEVGIQGLTLTKSPWLVAFRMPEGVGADKLVVLFWDADAKQWLELPLRGAPAAYKVVDLGNGRKVLDGVRQYTRTHLAVTVNFTGVFVLIQK